jgi:hypothetical protein
MQRTVGDVRQFNVGAVHSIACKGHVMTPLEHAVLVQPWYGHTRRGGQSRVVCIAIAQRLQIRLQIRGWSCGRDVPSATRLPRTLWHLHSKSFVQAVGTHSWRPEGRDPWTRSHPTLHSRRARLLSKHERSLQKRPAGVFAPFHVSVSSAVSYATRLQCVDKTRWPPSL